jgi:hypothetical protein
MTPGYIAVLSFRAALYAPNVHLVKIGTCFDDLELGVPSLESIHLLGDGISR